MDCHFTAIKIGLAQGCGAWLFILAEAPDDMAVGVFVAGLAAAFGGAVVEYMQ